MDAVGAHHHRDVDMVVDDEERAGCGGRLAEPARHLEQLTSRQGLVAELDHIGASAQGGQGDGEEVFGISIRRDDVQPGRV